MSGALPCLKVTFTDKVVVIWDQLSSKPGEFQSPGGEWGIDKSKQLPLESGTVATAFLEWSCRVVQAWRQGQPASG